MKQIFLFLTLFFSPAVMPMEQVYRYGIEPLSTCGAAVLPGASCVRGQIIGNDTKPQKSGPVYRVFSSYAKGLATKQSSAVLINTVVGLAGSYELLGWAYSFRRTVSYVTSPIDIMLDVVKDSDYFESAVAPLAQTERDLPLLKAAFGTLMSLSVNRVLLPKIVEYMPTLGQLLERWQQAHAPYSPNILDKSWIKPIFYAYCGYGAVLATEYYCRSFIGKRPKSSN